MTKIYTKEQIDSLGTSIGEAISAKSEETLQEVYRLIEELTPQEGSQGLDGKSSYELAVEEGFTGSIVEYLESLKGDKGDKGDTGAKGAKGDKGDQGVAGTNGIDGKDGIDGTNATNETVKNQNTGLDTKIWIGTQSEYDAVVTKDSDTLYMVK